MDVGFIGMGRMGRAMATRLAEQGHAVRAWNRSPEAARGLPGVTAVASAAEAFRGDAVITMLADDAALESVLVQGGLLDGAGRPGVHLGMSTISVALAERLTATALAQRDDRLAFLRDRELFGDLVDEPRFTEPYLDALAGLVDDGAHATVTRLQ